MIVISRVSRDLRWVQVNSYREDSIVFCMDIKLGIKLRNIVIDFIIVDLFGVYLMVFSFQKKMFLRKSLCLVCDWYLGLVSLVIIFFKDWVTKSKQNTCLVKQTLKSISWCTTNNNPIQQPSVHNPTNQQHLFILPIRATIHGGAQPENHIKPNRQTPQSHHYQVLNNKNPNLSLRWGFLGIDN